MNAVNHTRNACYNAYHTDSLGWSSSRIRWLHSATASATFIAITPFQWTPRDKWNVRCTKCTMILWYIWIVQRMLNSKYM